MRLDPALNARLVERAAALVPMLRERAAAAEAARRLPPETFDALSDALMRGGVTDFREAVERGARERLIPILMTAMTAALALVPLAVAGGRDRAARFRRPWPSSLCAGLITSTLLNMVVVPTMCLRYGRPPA